MINREKNMAENVPFVSEKPPVQYDNNKLTDIFEKEMLHGSTLISRETDDHKKYKATYKGVPVTVYNSTKEEINRIVENMKAVDSKRIEEEDHTTRLLAYDEHMIVTKRLEHDAIVIKTYRNMVSIASRTLEALANLHYKSPCLRHGNVTGENIYVTLEETGNVINVLLGGSEFWTECENNKFLGKADYLSLIPGNGNNHTDSIVSLAMTLLKGYIKGRTENNMYITFDNKEQIMKLIHPDIKLILEDMFLANTRSGENSQVWIDYLSELHVKWEGLINKNIFPDAVLPIETIGYYGRTSHIRDLSKKLHESSRVEVQQNNDAPKRRKTNHRGNNNAKRTRRSYPEINREKCLPDGDLYRTNSRDGVCDMIGGMRPILHPITGCCNFWMPSSVRYIQALELLMRNQPRTQELSHVVKAIEWLDTVHKVLPGNEIVIDTSEHSDDGWYLLFLEFAFKLGLVKEKGKEILVIEQNGPNIRKARIRLGQFIVYSDEDFLYQKMISRGVLDTDIFRPV